ncbi:TAXI family TRAP transporter solute-binding subunit [Suttonella ornithocola]|uniref:ABC-type taurine transport system, periplasmic component n=1 Tax=Suttonella ornithocola TaxID=279832 RepID=A0A380MSJ4_9GAMM|nr:TAXI family TRAP transporter solute-binding subunit [Suttonella ornithocola]SUO95550.1 ABC-type taurine transport system, periplasmic component [Suttonella ornithocola]
MRKMFKTSLMVGAVAMTVPISAADNSFVTIGTGGQTGVYYVVGQSICKLVNRDTGKTGIKCNAPSTGGSVDNLNAIAAGERQLGTVQSDSQYRAYHGEGEFEGKKNDKLRAVFSVYPEAFTLVARDDSGVKTFDDLKGKRVNIGNPGSGTRTTMEALMKEKGWTNADFAVAAELKPAEMASALCDNNLDVIAYTVGNPSGAIKEAAASCKSHLVSVDGKEVDKLVEEYPYYAKVTIPGGMYDGSPDDVKTLGVLATVVSSSDVPESAIYEVTKSVFDNFDRFKKLHPAFENITPEQMVTDGLSAPLHDGAKKYYLEKGWIKE